MKYNSGQEKFWSEKYSKKYIDIEKNHDFDHELETRLMKLENC